MNSDQSLLQSFRFFIPPIPDKPISGFTAEQMDFEPDVAKCFAKCLVRLVRNTALRGNPAKLKQGERILLHKWRKARHARDFETAGALLKLAKLCRYFIGMAELPQVLREIANQGWYVPLNLSIELSPKLKVLNETNPAEMEAVLLQFFSEKVDNIIRRVVKRHPSRKAVLLDAYKAHALELYSLSIPVFLAQVDGICGGSLFTRKKPRSFRMFLIETMNDQADIVDMLTWAITEEKPISAPPPKRTLQSLNRHAVMHGESVDYGTKRNSLQAVSLLAYVDSLFGWNSEAKHTKRVNKGV